MPGAAPGWCGVTGSPGSASGWSLAERFWERGTTRFFSLAAAGQSTTFIQTHKLTAEYDLVGHDKAKDAASHRAIYACLKSHTTAKAEGATGRASRLHP